MLRKSNLGFRVIADEIIGQVKPLVRGIEVNEEILALDVIAKVGPGGDFMSERHTFDTFRGEWFFPTLISRRRSQDWEDNGRPDLAANAQKKLLGIIENHQLPRLDEETKKRVHAIVERLQ